MIGRIEAFFIRHEWKVIVTIQLALLVTFIVTAKECG